MINRTILIPADEALLHQVGLPMSQTSISDHRMYGRHWLSAQAPKGNLGVLFGLGLYRNMNVMDGFMSVQRDERMYNIRLSKVLRPFTGDMEVGPLSIDVVKAFEDLRVCVKDVGHGISGEVRFLGTHTPHLEKHHLIMVDGTITTDMSRYDQVGAMSGWISIEGERIDLDEWWSVRNHSWGVRPGVGGFSFERGDHANPGQTAPGVSTLYLWSHYSTKDYSFQFSHMEDSAGNSTYVDGHLYYVDERPALTMVRLEHDISYFEGTKAVKSLRYRTHMSDGSIIEIEAEPSMRAWAYNGTGYGVGYFDCRGLGAQRGNPEPEYDVYDLSHPEIVRNPEGDVIYSGHREQPVRLTANGEEAFGHFPVMHM